MAGEALAKLLPEGGKVVMLRYAEGSASTPEREEGFLEEIGKHPNIQVLSYNQYGGADVEGAYKKAEALLHRFRRPDGSLDRRRASSPRTSRRRLRCCACSPTADGPAR